MTMGQLKTHLCNCFLGKHCQGVQIQVLVRFATCCHIPLQPLFQNRILWIKQFMTCNKDEDDYKLHFRRMKINSRWQSNIFRIFQHGHRRNV